MRHGLARVAAFVYNLRCFEGSDYLESARGESLDRWLGEHHAGTFPGYTRSHRPVVPVYSAAFE